MISRLPAISARSRARHREAIRGAAEPATMVPIDIEDDEEEDENSYEDSEGDDSDVSSAGDASESELDGDDLDEDYAVDDEEEEQEDEEEEEEEEEQQEEERRVSRRKRKGNDITSSGDEGDQEDLGEEGLYYKVVNLLQRKKNLNMLKLDECKAYLRKHGLRLTGSKSVCIQRVQEHWRLKDGGGEKLYPASSFVINCTGDVCTGDVILFKQRVYDKFDIVTRGGNIIGRRTIAGKVVKESYGAAKAQHTFTVEILWSKGVKPLPALYPLLVKGRNLYRLKTFRQRWVNEIERSKVLAEKHKRGATARHARAIKKAKSVVRGRKHHQNSHGRREPPTKRRRKEVKQKTVMEAHKKHQSNGLNMAKSRGREPAAGYYSVHGHPQTSTVQRNNLLHQSMPSNIHCHPMAELHLRGSRTAFHANRELPYSSTYKAGPSSTINTEVYNQTLNGRSFFDHPYSTHHLQLGSAHLSHPFNKVHHQESLKFPPLMHLDRWEAGVLRCQTPGCLELAVNGCVISCCWMCCRRSGRRCDRHT